MELELYADIPDGYELVGFRAPKEGDIFIDFAKGEACVSEQNWDISHIRMIVRKIKPRIKRSFRVDVLDKPDRKLLAGESGIAEGGMFITYRGQGGPVSHFDYTPCIVTELPVEHE